MSALNLALLLALLGQPVSPPPPPVVLAPAGPVRTVEARGDERQPLELTEKPARKSGSTPVVAGLIAVGAIGVGAGVIFGILASQDQSADTPEPVNGLEIHQRSYTAFNQANTFATAADASFIGGGAFILAGVLWAIASGGGGTSAPRAGPGPKVSWSF